jgi:hypothetical protein
MPPVLIATGLLATSCAKSSHEFISNAAPPVVICGTTLSSAASGAVVQDATRDHREITSVTVGGYLFIKVSDDCQRGATVNWTPSAGATLVKQALARDGRPVAVVLQPAQLPTHFALTATRDGVKVAYATVTLTS